MIELFKRKKLLFIGDSITDADRCEDQERGLGRGYAAMIADLLAARYPDSNVAVVNRGIGGDRVIDLERRWPEDVLALQPDWLSISVGINDVWRGLNALPPIAAQAVPLDLFRETYERLLAAVRAHTSARLVLMETSVIDENFQSEGNRRLEAYNVVIRDLARKYDAPLVPIRAAFRNAIAQRPNPPWTHDGVHPNSPGHMLMALAWMRALKLMD
jgi:lysophospholipase L1-like esterase